MHLLKLILMTRKVAFVQTQQNIHQFNISHRIYQCVSMNSIIEACAGANMALSFTVRSPTAHHWINLHVLRMYLLFSLYALKIDWCRCYSCIMI